MSGDGWVEPGFRSKLKETLEGLAEDDAALQRPQGVGWVECDEEQTRGCIASTLNDQALDADGIGLLARYENYLTARGLWLERLVVPHGPAPRTFDRQLQAEVQRQERIALRSSVRSEDLGERVEQAQLGYEREEARIDGVQQRATFFLGATGLTTSLVLVNGGLLYGSNALAPGFLRNVAGVLLLIAAILLFLSGRMALDATTITFDRVLPNSARQIRARTSLEGDEARRDLLAALLLAAQRAEAIGDWKLRELKRARLFFGLAVLFVLFAGIVVLLVALFGGGDAASHGLSFELSW